MIVPRYPTEAHANAADAVVEFFRAQDLTDAVLLTNSCARGKATKDSCLDIVVIVPEGADTATLDADWQEHLRVDPAFEDLRQAGVFSLVHLDLHDGRLDPEPHPEDEYPDNFEIVIGNLLVYAVPLWQRSDRVERLRRQWLPYYEEDLRQQRLAEVRWCCRHYLEHIPLYVERGLHFQSFARLYGAFRMFLQALFISRRTYPIAYDKWIHEQIVEILGLPELYARLPHLFEISHFESAELVGKAEDLEDLLDTFTGQGTLPQATLRLRNPGLKSGAEPTKSFQDYETFLWDTPSPGGTS